MFLRIINRENGSFITFPFLGGYYEQPARTMLCMELLQDIFCDKIAEDIETAKHSK